MNRSIEEITFDHQQEKITEAVRKSDKNTFRRSEEKLKNVLYTYAFVVVPLLFVVYPMVFSFIIARIYKHLDNYYLAFYYPSEWKKLGYRLINYSMLVLCLSSFSYLIYLVRKYHKLEYETNIKQMSVFFFNCIIYILIDVVKGELTSTDMLYTPTLCFFR